MIWVLGLYSTKEGHIHRAGHQSFHTSNISLLNLIILAPILGPLRRGQMYNNNNIQERLLATEWKIIDSDAYVQNMTIIFRVDELDGDAEEGECVFKIPRYRGSP